MWWNLREQEDFKALRKKLEWLGEPGLKEQGSIQV